MSSVALATVCNEFDLFKVIVFIIAMKFVFSIRFDGENNKLRKENEELEKENQRLVEKVKRLSKKYQVLAEDYEDLYDDFVELYQEVEKAGVSF